MKAFAAALLVLVTAGPPPGALNPGVTQENIHSTICVPGWTKTIRPTVAYTNQLKRAMLSREPSGRVDNMQDYELDHYIPLELGGNPTDPNNLWPQPWLGTCGAHVKDKMENLLHKQVCAGMITLADAQATIKTGCWSK